MDTDSVTEGQFIFDDKEGQISVQCETESTQQATRLLARIGKPPSHLKECGGHCLHALHKIHRGSRCCRNNRAGRVQ